MASTSRGNFHFLGTYEDDRSQLESGLYKNGRSYNNDDHTSEYNKFHLVNGDQSGAAAIDPRLLMLLKYFRELYFRKTEMFKKIFPGVQDEFAEFSGKISAVLLSPMKMKQRQGETMKRSLSLGSHRTRGIGGGKPPLRPERFKVRTVVVDDGVDQGQAGGGGQPSQG